MKNTYTTLILIVTSFIMCFSQNNSLSFDGSDDYVVINNDAEFQINVGTIEAWIRRTSASNSGYRGIVIKERAYGLFLLDNELIAFDWNANTNRNTGSFVNDLNWHHVAMSFDSGVTNGTKIYLDGTLVLTTTMTVLDHTRSLVIGGGKDNTPLQIINANVDEVRIWNDIRTPTEIQNNKDFELNGNEAGLVSYYTFNQGTAEGNNSGLTTLTDKTSSANSGTLNNFSLNGASSNWVSDNPTLPVELINFSGKSMSNEIMLEWSTASEINNSGFEIQRSQNGREWETIDFLEGHGTSIEVNQYQYLDRNPILGTNYYRLKQIDFDRAFEYSDLVAVEYNSSNKNVHVFPNPSNGIINLQLDTPPNQRVSIQISDNLGRKVSEQYILEGEASWSKELRIKSAGIYFLIVQVGNEIYHERIIVNDYK